MKDCARFKDEAIEAALNSLGYVHIPGFLSAEEVSRLFSFYKLLHTDVAFPKPMWNSLYDLPHGRGMEASEQINKLLHQKFQGVLEAYAIPIATFMVKNPTADSNCDLHRDNTAFDEARFEYRNGWIPLVDINHQNGALYVVPKSHEVFDYCLPMETEWQYKRFIPELMKHIRVVYANAGDLVVYKDRMLHGSFRNQTQEPRPVLHFGMLHPDAETCYYRRSKTGDIVDVFKVPPHFFFEKDFGRAVEGAAPVRSFKYEPPVLSIESVIEKIKT